VETQTVQKDAREENVVMHKKIIHRSEVENTSHIGVDNGRNTTKVNGVA
jgi:hypothetical protein